MKNASPRIARTGMNPLCIKSLYKCTYINKLGGKIGIVISTNEVETVWSAFRLGITALNGGNQVKVFLMNKGVEIEDVVDEKFDVKEKIKTFTKNKGEILACGTCLKIRQKESIKICPISTMEDLLRLIEESDKVLTFG